MRGFVSPGQLLTIEARIEHEGSGYRRHLGQGCASAEELKSAAPTITFRVKSPFPDPVLACPHGRDGRQKIGFPLAGDRRMTESESPPPKEAWITGIGIVSSLGEGTGCALGRAQRQKRINIDDPALCALHRSSAGAGFSFDAQIPEKRRSAPDGSLAAHRHLCRGAGAGLRRASRAITEILSPDGHDRRGRRRRARCPGRSRRFMQAYINEQFRSRLSQRTADERLAADPVSDPAVQPACRQHRHRSRRFRHLADVHGRGSSLASTPPE